MGFDPIFYKTKYIRHNLYSDVTVLRVHFIVSSHLLKLFGKRRYSNANAWLSALEEKFGHLPNDFNAELYLSMYPDLQSTLNHTWQAKGHYIEYGRKEGRTYKPSNTPGNRVENAAEVWVSRFNAAEFIALNPLLAAGVNTNEEAIKLFIEQGIDAVAPMALNSMFDPVFYKLYYKEIREFSPAQAYRHWLFKGLPEGRVGSESQLLKEKLIGRTLFPSAFDWKLYGKRLAPICPDVEQTRWSALEHLLQHGFEESRDIPMLEGDKNYLFECIADFLWGRGKKDSARKALEMCLKHDSENGAIHHKLGDYLLETGFQIEAKSHFIKAYAFNYRSIWTYLTLAELASLSGDFESAYRYLAESKNDFSGERPWRQKLEDVISRHYDRASDEARSLFKMNDRTRAEERFEHALKRITRAYQELDELPVTISFDGPHHVVMFSLLTVPQCRHYRVEQRLQQFQEFGIKVLHFGGHQPYEAASALVGACALIVYREPAIPTTIKLILHAKALGLRTFYEIDDLIFDSNYYPEPIENYGPQVTFDEYIGLLCGVVSYRFAMSLCDEGITTTKQLASHIQSVVTQGVCHVIPNGMDARNEPFVNAPATFPINKDLFIFYGAGTKTHNRNFNECVAPALSELMSARHFVKLIVVGYLDLDPVLNKHLDRIIRLEFCQDISTYWSLLSNVHINLGALTIGEMNDCKSEIKWLEAAVVGVPSIVSDSATYRTMLEDGVDALLVHSIDDWRDALFRLVDDPSLRAKVGMAARRRAKNDYSLAANASKLRHIFEPILRGQIITRRVETIRVLLVHVFFPPQTLGGATRVVRDIVDDLSSRYAGVCEVAVYTTDFGEVAGRSRVGGYGDVPVFRFAPSLPPGAESNFEDQAIEAHFTSVLDAWKPDIVHLHCIQFLTASIAAACRRRGIPYIVTVHDGWWLSRYQFFIDEGGLLQLPSPDGANELNDAKSALRELRRKHYLAEQLREADAITAVSEIFGKLYSSCIHKEVRTTENGLAVDFINKARRNSVRNSQHVRIGHIGGLFTIKGAFLLETALRGGYFNNIEAVVVDHTKEATFSMPVVWGGTKVAIRGKTPPDRVGSLYDELDVLIAPSIWPESYGLVTREALAYGLWVVTSDLGAIGEDIVEGVNGFKINVRNAEALSRVLQLINDDPETFLTPPNFKFTPRSITRQTDEFVSLYQELIKSCANSRQDVVTRGRSVACSLA
jgi:glycosyltransferase involved in cell wall biosynthesis